MNTPPVSVADEASAIDRVMTSLVSPGSTLTSVERRTAVLGSRRAMADWADGDQPPATPDDPVDDADGRGWLVKRLTTAAHTVRPVHLEQLAAAGIDSVTYIELLSLVARLQAVDTFCFGIGVGLPDVPQPIDGAPTGDTDDAARVNGGWVPTVGPASPPNALSLIPAEHDAMHDLHGAFYLSVEEMADVDADRGLHRTQMEYVAARTSLLNECFF